MITAHAAREARIAEMQQMLFQLETRYLNRADIARRLGLSNATISRWAHGRDAPTVGHLQNARRLLEEMAGQDGGCTGRSDHATCRRGGI